MDNKHFDIAVIGGGPAGLIAAGRAAAKGASVVLLEKNDKLGKKLLITGKGRCNLTNYELDDRKFIEPFGKNGRFLFSALSRFGVEASIKFFNDQGVATKVERGNRVFPVSDQAGDILTALVNYLQKNKVTVLKNSAVKKIVSHGSKIEKLLLFGGKEIVADKYIIATGGLSYPATGSTGDGYNWAKDLGHTLIKPRPALVPIIVKESWVNELEGLSLKNVNISVWQNNKKQADEFGEALFTDNGLSGPIILDLSKKIGELLVNGAVELKIDFKPALDYPTLDERLLRDFAAGKNKMFKNGLDLLLPKKLIPVMINLSGIKPNKTLNTITKIERNNLLHLLKEFKLTVKKMEVIDQAIITSGGVALNEIDPKNMKSKIVNNLYFCGEILDLDGPTGGYNLQVCWCTGYVAGENAAA